MEDGTQQRELEGEELGLSWSAMEIKEEGGGEEVRGPEGERVRRAPVMTGDAPPLHLSLATVDSPRIRRTEEKEESK